MSFSFHAHGTKKGVIKKVREDGQIGDAATQGHKAVGDFIVSTLENAHDKVSFVKVTASGSHSRWESGGTERTSGNVNIEMAWGTFDPDPEGE